MFKIYQNLHGTKHFRMIMGMLGPPYSCLLRGQKTTLAKCKGQLKARWTRTIPVLVGQLF